MPKKQLVIEKPKSYFRATKPVLAQVIKGDCFTAMDKMIKEGKKFDMIFADPPYFLSNGGITCQSGKMVKVDKGDWDESQGPELNHEFNTEWIRRCKDLLADHGTLWVSGTMHIIYSVGFAMQQLEMKILNNVTWQKPNPPPNLAGRYFTHSTETLLWARKSEKSKHKYNYSLMKEENEEYLEAALAGDAVEVADALGDMMYILCGTILSHGMQHIIEEIFEEIQASNMSKLGADGKPIYREDGKVMKGPSYFKPNIGAILEKHLKALD